MYRLRCQFTDTSRGQFTDTSSTHHVASSRTHHEASSRTHHVASSRTYHVASSRTHHVTSSRKHHVTSSRTPQDRFMYISYDQIRFYTVVIGQFTDQRPHRCHWSVHRSETTQIVFGLNSKFDRRLISQVKSAGLSSSKFFDVEMDYIS